MKTRALSLMVRTGQVVASCVGCTLHIATHALGTSIEEDLEGGGEEHGTYVPDNVLPFRLKEKSEMTVLETDLDAIPFFPDVDDGESHIVCCHEDQLTLCGLGVAELEFMAPLDAIAITCENCIELDEEGVCPLSLTCPEVRTPPGGDIA